jgi:alcohol dehydrogenase class IV
MTGGRSTWSFFSAGRVLFGWGAVRELGAAAKRLRVGRVFIIADPIMQRVGLVERVAHPLREAGIECGDFIGGEPEPSFECAEAAIVAAREFRPDGIVGLGGGSNMDLAKITANVVTHGGHFSQYFHFDNVPGPVLPLICVPTTAGTGSEVSHAAVLTDHANQIKVSTLSQHLRPQLAVVDPELTLSCPPKATADSGIDALTHAIEAYLATRSSDLDVPAGSMFAYEGKHPLGDVLAEKAIALIGEHLVTAVQRPDDLAARTGMALAATLAGLAFSNCGVALVHAMEYPLGGALHCSHGEGNGLLLPYVMRFKLPERVPELARVAALLGENTAGLSAAAAAERACERVERLRSEIGIRTQIREFGGKAEQLPEFARKAFAIKRLMQLTPRQVTEEAILQIYQDAL